MTPSFTLVDAKERAQIRERVNENMLVEAGAGTGKTTVLVDRIVHLLRTTDTDVRRIAVITFTEKAAAELAARVRRWDPDVRFVMGGPAVRTSLLDLPPYRDGVRGVDAIATGEGEEVVRQLARHHRSADFLDHVPGLLVPHALGWRATAPIERPVLDDYASPYELGRVPPGLAGFVETFRGCPIHCEFCQWGEQKADRVHGADYLERHLRGLATTDAATIRASASKAASKRRSPAS